MLTRLAMRDNSTRARADQAFYELAYPNHPYAIDEEGYPETIRAITRDDLVDFHRRHFGPRGMILTIVGAVRAEEAVALVERFFGDWDNTSQPRGAAAAGERPETVLTAAWPCPARSRAT